MRCRWTLAESLIGCQVGPFSEISQALIISNNSIGSEDSLTHNKHETLLLQNIIQQPCYDTLFLSKIGLTPTGPTLCINLVYFVFIVQLCNDYETVCVGHMLEALCPLCPFGNLLLLQSWFYVIWFAIKYFQFNTHSIAKVLYAFLYFSIKYVLSF